MTSREWRDATLEGAAAAADVHERLSLRDTLRDGHAPIDVFRVIAGLDVGFLFRPLGNLLGAFLPAPLSGIIVTTQRDLYVQRYTAAHELGHFLLGHEVSLDDDGCIGFVARGGDHRNPQEIAADAFASEFLMPRWLLAAHVERQGWTSEALSNPGVIYQLSLRLGVSYQAMCWALVGHNVIRPGDAQRLVKIPPRRAKLETLERDFLDDSWANVWALTSRDNGIEIFGNPNDVIQVELPERAGAGLTWNVEAVKELGFEVLADTRQGNDSETIGAFGSRKIAIRGSGSGHLHLEERRHWDLSSTTKETFELWFYLDGKESGTPRVVRERLH